MMCYNCNKKLPKDQMAYAIENTVTGDKVAWFCSEKCLREKLPFTKIEAKPQ